MHVRLVYCACVCVYVCAACMGERFAVIRLSAKFIILQAVRIMCRILCGVLCEYVSLSVFSKLSLEKALRKRDRKIERAGKERTATPETTKNGSKTNKLTYQIPEHVQMWNGTLLLLCALIAQMVQSISIQTCVT